MRKQHVSRRALIGLCASSRNADVSNKSGDYLSACSVYKALIESDLEILQTLHPFTVAKGKAYLYGLGFTEDAIYSLFVLKEIDLGSSGCYSNNSHDTITLLLRVDHFASSQKRFTGSDGKDPICYQAFTIPLAASSSMHNSLVICM